MAEISKLAVDAGGIRRLVSRIRKAKSAKSLSVLSADEKALASMGLVKRLLARAEGGAAGGKLVYKALIKAPVGREAALHAELSKKLLTPRSKAMKLLANAAAIELGIRGGWRDPLKTLRLLKRLQSGS